MLSPRDEWRRIAGEGAAPAFAYCALLGVLPTAASFFMLQSSPLPLSPNAVPLTYVSTLLAFAALAAAFWVLGRMQQRAAPWKRCLQLAAYGATPLGLASVTLVSPVLAMVCVVALLHVFYLYYVGAQALLGVPEDDAAQFVTLACVLAIGGASLGGGAIGALGLL